MSIENDEMINTTEAADILGVTVNAIRNRIHRGTLKGVKKRGSWEWQVKKADVEQLVKGKPGRREDECPQAGKP